MGSVFTVTAVFEAVDKMTSVVSGIERSLKSTANTMKQTGKILSATLTAPLVGFGAYATKAALDFDKAMTGVNAVLKLSGSEFESYKDEVLEFSTTTSQSSADVAMALRGIVSSGYGATDAMEILRVSVDAAGNMMTDTETTTRALSSVLRAFGMEATDVTHVADVLETAANNSAIEFEALTGSIGNATGIAAAAGVPFETLTAALMTVTDAGYGVEEASTAVRALITSLLSPTDDLATMIGEWGYESGEAALAAMGLDQMMTNLYDSTGGSAAQIGDLLGNIRASKAAFALGAENGLNLAASMDEIAAASQGAGEHAAMADVRHQSWGYHVAKLKSEVEVFAIRLANLFIPEAIKVVDVLKEWFTSLAQANPQLLKIIGIIAILAASLGPLLIIAGSVLSAIASIGAVLGAAAAPILLLVAAIVVLGVAFATNWGGIRDKALEVWGQIQPVLLGLWQWLQVAIPQALMIAQQWFADVWAAIQPTVMNAVIAIQGYIAQLQPVFQGMQDAAATVVAWVIENWPLIQQKVQEVMTVVQTVITTVINEVIPFAVEMFGKIVNWVIENWPLIQQTVGTVLGAVQSVVSTILGWIAEFWEAHGQTILDTVSAVWETIKSVISIAIDTVLAIITAVMQAINGDWEAAWETIKSAAETIWEAIKSAAETVWEALKTAIETVITTLQSTLETTWETIKSTAETVWENLKTAVVEKAQGIYDEVSAKIDEIKTFIEDFDLKTVGEALIEGLIEGVKSKAQDLINAAVSLVRNAIQAAKDALREHSPSLVFVEIGQNIAQGLIDGIQSKAGDVTEAIEGLFGAAGVVSGLGGTAARLMKSRMMDPLSEQIKALDTAIDAAQAEITNTSDMYAMIYWQDELNRLMDERAEAAERYAEMEEKALALQKQQEDLNFLQQQVKLLDLIAEHGLDAEAILGGMELGVNASLEGIVDAMTKALEAIVAQTEETLGISSPSKVMGWVGRMAMEGLALGAWGARDQVASAFRDVMGRAVVEGVYAGRMAAAGSSHQTTDNRQYHNNSTVNVNGASAGIILDAMNRQI